MTGAPCPMRSNAMVVPSLDMTVLMRSSSDWAREPLPLLGRLLAETLLLLPQLGGEFLAEVLGLEHLANLELDLTVAVERWPALDPFDRLLPRVHLDHREAGNQLLRLGERPVGDGGLS